MNDAPALSPSDLHARRHEVHFYEGATALDAPAEFVSSGLIAGCAVLVVATEEHTGPLKSLLARGFVDVDRAMRDGRLKFLAAETVKNAVCPDGEPVWELFVEHVVSEVRAMNARGARPVRVFGEVVDLLCRAGNAKAAVRLEEMWKRFSESERFELLCAYDVAHFEHAESDEIAKIAHLHSHVRGVDPAPASAERERALEATIRRAAEVEGEVREKSRINTNLVRIAEALSSELDLERLVQKVTDEATALCRAQFGAFFHNVIDDKGESYMLYSLSGVPREAFARFPMPRNTDVFRPTFDGTSLVVRSPDITKDPRYGKNAPRRGMPEGHLPVRSYLAVSVKSRSGEILGGLFFGHAEVGVFTRGDEELVATVAAQAAVAMDNARLFQAMRRAESAAQDEREKLRQLFKRSPAMVGVLRGPDLVYEYANDAALRLIGRTDVIDKPIREAWPELTSESLRRLEEVYRSGQRWSGDAIPMVRDWNDDLRPHPRYFNLVFEPFRRPEGQTEGVMAFGFDVTEQVIATHHLESLANELELANRMKDEFLATVSHELRTPLNAMLGWVRMLRGGTLPAEKHSRALETIERNANAQAQLIEDLLDVSRIISGKLRLDVAPVDLPEVIENAIEAVRPAAEAKEIAIRPTLDTIGSAILGDRDRLQQVVWNLLTNAVKFTPKGGSVRVALRKAESSIEIIVADNGLGISADFVNKVFERFRQADATSSRKQGGLGLGLAIVRHLVELHGGAVRAESEGLGKGATFTVVLPVSPLRAKSVERPPALRGGRPTGTFEPPREIEGAHVLVVDDEPDARTLLAEILGSCKARVTTAASADEALRLVREIRPDILISDIGMPDKDGYVLIRELRALGREEGGKTPSVALTAYARLEDRTKALVAGFNMHVPKPVEPSELLAVLRSLVVMFKGE